LERLGLHPGDHSSTHVKGGRARGTRIQLLRSRLVHF
jgi:hypothetical protein